MKNRRQIPVDYHKQGKSKNMSQPRGNEEKSNKLLWGNYSTWDLRTDKRSLVKN